MDVEERVFDDDEEQRAWLEGCRREEAISGLLERHGDKRLSIKDVDEVAWETPPRSEIIGDDFDSGSMTGIDSRIPSALELLERLPDVQTKPSDR